MVGEVDPAGNVTASDRYDVYGAVRGRTGTATTAHGFVGSLGHLSDAANGLVYMRARYYDPGTGRFTCEDKDAQGANWYSYCDDDPINRSDYDGNRDTGKALDQDAHMWNAGNLWAITTLFLAVASTACVGSVLGAAGFAAAALFAAQQAIICYEGSLGGLSAAQSTRFGSLQVLDVAVGAFAGPGISLMIAEQIDGASMLGKFAGGIASVAAGAILGYAFAEDAALLMCD